MATLKHRRKAAGFTAVEALLVVVIVGIAAAVLIPALGQLIRTTKMIGVTRENASLLRRCRFEAIKRGVPCRIFMDVGRHELVAFADVHGTGLTDPPDGAFSEIPGQPRGATDYEVQRQQLPALMDFAFGAATGIASVDGFTGANKEAVFQPNGSIADAGAYRFQDPYGNSLEVRVTTAAGARVEVLKWDGAAWRSQGEGDKAWQWK